LIRSGHTKVLIHQSRAFSGSLSPATELMAKHFLGTIVWTQVASQEESLVGSTSDPSRFSRSLRLMRTRMLRTRALVGAIFIGGMEGIRREARLLATLHPRVPIYFVGAPGGAAKDLSETAFRTFLRQHRDSAGRLATKQSLLDSLRASREYSTLMQRAVLDMAKRTR
jgi:hypothetical protein